MLLVRYLREVFKAHLEFVLCCWDATLEKYSRHTWSLFVLLGRYPREVFKAHLEFVCAAGTLP